MSGTGAGGLHVWRERRGVGVLGLSGRATAAGLAVCVVLLVLAMTDQRLFILSVPLAAVAAVLIVPRWHGQTLGGRALRRLAWAWAGVRGHRRYLSFPAGRGRPGDPGFPGPLAGVAAVRATDQEGRPLVVLWNRSSESVTGVFEVAAEGPWLTEPDGVARWVDAWHRWLAELGHRPEVRHCAVTVETGLPTTGIGLEPAQDGACAPPESALRIVSEAAGKLSETASCVRTRVSLCLSAAGSRRSREAPAAAVSGLVRAMANLGGPLQRCGVSVVGVSDLPETVARIRTAFDPRAARPGGSLPEASPGQWAQAAWADARPVAVEERWSDLRHDCGLSVSWGWDEAPRQAVGADVLARLSGPSDYRKRVTVVVTPTPAHRAHREVDEQASAAAFRAAFRSRFGRTETARERVDREMAERSAEAEARGAGLVDVAVYVTATALDEQDLERVVADVEQRAAESHIRLRRGFGSQLAMFCAGLSAGVDPADLGR